MTAERTTASAADGAPASGRESVEAALRRLELAVTRVARLGDQVGRDVDLFTAGDAGLKAAYDKLRRDHQALLEAHQTLVARQREAETRLVKTIARVKHLVAEAGDPGQKEN